MQGIGLTLRRSGLVVLGVGFLSLVYGIGLFFVERDAPTSPDPQAGGMSLQQPKPDPASRGEAATSLGVGLFAVGLGLALLILGIMFGPTVSRWTRGTPAARTGKGPPDPSRRRAA